MTNAKKTAAPQPTAPKTYAVTPHLLAEIHAVEMLLAKRKSIEDKIATGITEAKAAEAPYEEALNRQADADANLALAIEAKEHVEREKAADAAADAVEAAQRAKTRSSRTVQALCRMAAETDQEIAVARVAVEVEIGLLSGDALAIFADDLNESMKPLIAALARGQALANATRSRRLNLFLAELLITNPEDPSGQNPLVDRGAVTIDGQAISFASLASTDPTATAITEALRSVGDIRAKLDAHRPFVHPDQRPKPYVLKGETLAFRRQEYGGDAPAHEVITVSSHR